MSKQNIIKSALGVSGVMMFGYVLSFCKEALVANYFGVSSLVDAYSIAIQVPVLLFAFISVSIKSVVIPNYSDVLYNQGETQAHAYANKLMTLIAGIALLMILAAELLASPLIYLFAPGFDAATHESAVSMLRVVMPVTFFAVQVQVFTAILNVHKQFVLPSMSVYCLNTGLIVAIVTLHARLGIWSACIGQLIGEALALVFIAFVARKFYRYHFTLDVKDEHVKTSMKMALPVLWTMSIAEVNAIVNRVIGSFLIAGSISALSYAGKIDAIMMSLFLSALTTVVYPMYAESAAKSDMAQLARRVNSMLSIISMFLIPLMCGIFIFKYEVVSLVFGRGKFDEDAIMRTQSILGFYVIGMLFMSFRNTLTNIYHSLKDTQTPAVNATKGAVLNVVLNIIFAYLMGVEGLALARSLVAIYITANLLFLITKKWPEITLTYLFKNLRGIVPSAAIMFAVVYAFDYFVHFDSHIFTILVGAAVGVVVYAVCLQLFKVPIFNDLQGKLIRK